MENNDSLVNTNWDALLKIFKAIIENPDEKTSEKLTSLKELAKTKTLTPRQYEGITERCNNYMKGNWGVDAIKDAYVANTK